LAVDLGIRCRVAKAKHLCYLGHMRNKTDVHTATPSRFQVWVRFPILTALFLVYLFAMSDVCRAAGNTGRKDVLPVFVSIPPQIHFVKAIGKARVDCSAMVGPAHSPATYEPTPQQIVALGKARLYFQIGVPFEAVWMKRIQAANRDMNVIDTSRGVDFLPMKQHYHANGHAHGKGKQDPHIWLSINAVKHQARNICDALVDVDPDNSAFYKKNRTGFLAELDRLDRTIADSFADLDSRKFIAIHPAWGYFARDYNLEQIPVELEGKQPSAKSLTQLIQLAEKEDIRVVVVQKQFSTASAEVIAKIIGAQIVQLNPLDPDYVQNMKQIAATLREAMK